MSSNKNDTGPKVPQSMSDMDYEEVDEFGNLVGDQEQGPSASYGQAVQIMDDVEIIVQEEDTEPITQPIVNPIVVKNFSFQSKDGEIPRTRFNWTFAQSLMENAELVRNVAIVGNFLCGKTSLMDCLVEQTHIDFVTTPEKPIKFSDTLYTEQERGISIKSSPLTIIHQNIKDKSFLLNLMDTPGHVNFTDEVSASLRLCDGVVLVVDAVEGVMLNTKRLISLALMERLNITLCINKIDRLILELRFPPRDAYFKLKRIIDEVNALIGDKSKLVSPTLGNVCFMSSLYSVCFTLDSFAKSYFDRSPPKGKYSSASHVGLARRLWGNFYKIYDETTSSTKFIYRDEPPTPNAKLSFVEFILEPLYKLFRMVIEQPELGFLELSENYRIVLSKKEQQMNVKPLLKIACSRFFGSFKSFVEMISSWVPSPKSSAALKCQRMWTGPYQKCKLASAISQCDPKGPLIMHITKQYPSQDGTRFNVFGLVVSGTLRVDNEVKVLGESYSDYDEEESRTLPVSRLWICNSRYNVEVRSIPAGNWALVEGIDQPIVKSATIIGSEYQGNLYIFKPLKFNTQAVIKVAVEPVNPSELPKMLEGFRKCNKSYPLLQTKVEASGEHVLIGNGELYLDCVMHDLRHMYAEIDIRVSDPGVCFSETVISTSSEQCVGESPNQLFQFTMVAEPLDKKLVYDMESENISMEYDEKYFESFFKREHNWDNLSTRSIWAFGPEQKNTNMIVNDTLDYEVDPIYLEKIKAPIVQAFQWSSREGPLCDEPMRGVKFKLQHALMVREPIPSDVSQVISTIRKASYLSFLKAQPRLMEPYVFVEIVAPSDVVYEATDKSGRRIKSLLEKIITEERRGRILSRSEIAGSPLYRVEATIPAIDSFGFETDLRVRTTGQAFCQSVFHEWRILPDDPLNKKVDAYLTALEPQRTEHLAREFLLKTRRRKGLSEDVNVEMYMLKPK